MPFDTALFWLIVGGFLYFDNLILVPRGMDVLRCGRDGRLRYDASPRLVASGKEIVLLSPLNFFDRALVTTHSFGDVEPTRWRECRRWLKVALPTLNGLCTLGYAYMVLVLGLAVLSIYAGLAPALLGFIGLHLLVWVMATVAIVQRRQVLQFGAYETFAASAEALFVPAYLMNLGKRLIYKKRVEISSLGLGLRNLKRTNDDDERVLNTIMISERLDMLEMMQGHELPLDQEYVDGTQDTQEESRQGPGLNQGVETIILSPTQIWILKARACLTT